VLPGLVSGDDPDAAERYSAAAWAVLEAEACGWIVGLRGNGGGNLIPMLIAIAPLLGPGPTVSYRRRDGTTDVYRLDSGGNLIAPDGSALAAVPARAAPSSRRGLAIAVLQGGSTASAGEGVLMALVGRPNVETFGDETFGIPTGNSLVEFADGSAINLTQAIGIDAAGIPHETAIKPGIPTPGRRTDQLDAARDWILAQPSCRR
jgi:carboxyl-terminal processing protease